jgi:hypothetical protein
MNQNKTPDLVLRVAIPLTSASHGIRIAQSISRLYSGVADIVSTSDRKVVLANREISRIELQQD